MTHVALSVVFVGLAFVTGILVNWIRHRPRNLTRGTQHILLLGLVVQTTFIGIASALLIIQCGTSR